MAINTDPIHKGAGNIGFEGEGETHSMNSGMRMNLLQEMIMRVRGVHRYGMIVKIYTGQRVTHGNCIQ